MHKQLNSDQRGIAHLGLILLVVVVIGGIGFAGWRVMNKDKQSNNAVKLASIEAGKECMKEYNDKDLCKFLSSWSINKKFKVESTTTAEGKTNKTVMTIDGDNSYMKMEGEYAMEVISIGDVSYTKAGETWWKQSTKKTEATDTPVSKDDFKFEEPKAETEAKDLTKYEKVGKEACGDDSCFKYKVVDPANTETTEYIWFDDDDYLVRKTLSEGKDGTKSESTFSYDNVSVKEPTPVKELGPNQYIVPGQTEPTTLPAQPTQAEIDAMMQQYSQ